MDFKKIVEKVTGTAEDLKEKAEVKIKETRESLDKDHDGIPDAVQGLTDKAKTLAAQALEKAKKVNGMAEEKFEQAKARVGDMADQTKTKLAEAKGAAKQAIDATRDCMSVSGKESKNG